MPQFFKSRVVRTVGGLAVACAVVVVLDFSLPAQNNREAPAESKPVETWEVVVLGGSRIGYTHSSWKKTTRNGRQVVVGSQEQQLNIKRFGQKTVIRTKRETTETLDGTLLSFTFEMRILTSSLSRTVGTVDGELVKLKMKTAGREQNKTANWEAGTKSPTWSERSFLEQPLKPGETRTIPAYQVELNTVSRDKYVAAGVQEVKLADGERHRLLKVRVTQSVNPTMPIDAWYDQRGRLWKVETNFLGKKMESFRVSKEEAMKEIAGEELDIAVNGIVSVPGLRNAHSTKRVVYRVKTPGENPLDTVPTGNTQSTRRVDDSTIELTVTSIQPPERDRQTRVKPAYLASNRYLQADDRRVIQHARSAASSSDPIQAAYQMERYVHGKLRSKNFSTALASAAEVAASLEGDCTEHAVLLAAMLRSRKIPSRLAVGLVYVESLKGFGGHMWTEALLNGEWIPLDATLGQGGIGAAHIKLADSSFADDAPAPVTSFLPLLKILGNVEIEVLSKR